MNSIGGNIGSQGEDGFLVDISRNSPSRLQTGTERSQLAVHVVRIEVTGEEVWDLYMKRCRNFLRG